MKHMRAHTEGSLSEKGRESQVIGWERLASLDETKLMGQKMCPQRELDS